MSNKKLIDDLWVLLAELQEMETAFAKKSLEELKRGYAKIGMIEIGKGDACNIITRKLVEILHEAKK